MNSTATGGKNLHTVFAVGEGKGAYEMGLISPAVPDLNHHPLFSSLAQRQLTPVPEPSSAHAVTPRTARNYGGRSIRYRWDEQLKPWQVHMLHEADAVASQLGLPLNAFLTVNYHGTFAGSAAMRATFALGMKRMCQWLRNNGVPAAYVYTHENPGDEKPNSHVLVHVPPRILIALKKRAGEWFDALDGGVQVDPRNDTQRRAKGQGTRLAYMCKGADDFTCRRYGGRRAKGGQGPITFKRAGVAQLLRKGTAGFATGIARARAVAI